MRLWVWQQRFGTDLQVAGSLLLFGEDLRSETVEEHAADHDLAGPAGLGCHDIDLRERVYHL